MDLLAKMATYVRVVESGSLSAAARQLRISAPAVSRQIAALEAEVRTPLLTRSTRKMTVTDAGRSYYERCLRVLRDVDFAQEVGRADGVEGPLRISAPVTFGLARVAPQMHAFMKKHPAVLVELQLEDRLVDFVLEGVDVAIRVGAAPSSGDLVAQKLVTYERCLVASPSYLRRRGAARRPEALAAHDALMPFTGPTDTWALHCEAKEVRVRPRVVFRTNALHAVRELAVQGAGVALLPEWFVAPLVAEGALRVLLPAWRPAPVAANALYRRDTRGAAQVKALVEHLRGALR